MQAAMRSAPKVYLDRGTYLESITLPGGITLQGGWASLGGQWTHSCDPTTAILQAPQTSNTTVLASGGTANLDTLTIKSKPPQNVAPGESLFGIRAVGASTNLTLTNVAVYVGDGGPGATGMNGSAGANTSNGCDGRDGLPGGAGG
jgi:hypothetical protein